MVVVLLMGIIDVVAGLLLFNSFGDIGFYLAIALLLKGSMSVMSSHALRAAMM